MGGQRCFRHCLWLGLDELGCMLAIALTSFAPAVAQSTPVAQSIPAAALAAASLSLAAAAATASSAAAAVAAAAGPALRAQERSVPGWRLEDQLPRSQPYVEQLGRTGAGGAVERLLGARAR
eukprot:scaffold44213_cov50-Phaeocystis_antarctica.AAC.2